MKHLRSKTYVRIFLFFASCSVAVIIPFTLLMCRQFSGYAYSEINAYDADNVGHIAQNMDFILNTVNLYGIRMYEDPNLRGWMTGDVDDPIAQQVASMTIRDYLSTEPFIHETYLVNMNTRKVLASMHGEFSFGDFFDPGMLDIIQNSKPVYQTFFAHKVDGQTCLAVIVPSQPAHQETDAYLVLLLDNSTLENYLFGGGKSSGIEGGGLVVDGSGSVLLVSDENPVAGLNLLRISGGKPKSGLWQVRIHGTEWLLNESDMSVQNWHVFGMTKLGSISAKVYSFQQRMILYFSLLLSALLACLLLISLRYFRPITKLANQVQGTLGNKLDGAAAGKNDEISLIRNGFSIMKRDIDTFDLFMKSHQRQIKEDYLRQWLLQGRLNASARAYLQTETGLTACAYICVTVLRIDAYDSFLQKYDYASQQLVKYRIVQTAENCLKEAGVTAEGADLGNDHIVLLIGCNDPENDALDKPLLRAGQEIETRFGCQTALSLSEAERKESNLRVVYDTTYEVSFLKFIRGENKVYREREYRDFFARKREKISEDAINRLVQEIRVGNVQSAVVLLDQIFEHMHAQPYSESKRDLVLLLYIMGKNFKGMEAVLNGEGADQFLNRFSTLSEVYRQLKERIEEIIAANAERKTSERKEKLVVSIVDYVKNHIQDPMLSVDEVADYCRLSAGYVRLIFKEVYGSTLADYILEERMNKVRQLLAETDGSVQSIADRAGFQTKSHFYTTFRKITGMTPTQYREEALKNAEHRE